MNFNDVKSFRLISPLIIHLRIDRHDSINAMETNADGSSQLN